MTVTEELVREQLRKVIDPELFVNIVDLGLIYVVELEEGHASAPTEATEAGEESIVAEDALGSGGDAAACDAEGENSQVVTNVKIDMTMTSPMCPAGPQLVSNSKQVVAQLEGIGEVEVRVVMDPPWTPDMMTDDAKDQLGIF